MKLVSYKGNEQTHLGILTSGKIYNLHACDASIPDSMNNFLWGGEALMERAREAEARIRSGQAGAEPVMNAGLTAPVPNPASCRDAYAFRQHVAAARRNRGVEMVPEFDQYPVFYFTNHHAVQGPGDIWCMPDHFEKLDFELELAVVLGKQGRNIKAEEADAYIAGFTIMNDMSARRMQMEEMKLNLGPAKGKDFATVIGPWMVTPDELKDRQVKAKAGHTGINYDLQMTCRVNGTEVSRGNAADMDWTFAEIIERCAYGCEVLPGDVIGSGTVGTGCFLELNGTGRLNDPGYQEQWLQPGDVVEMEITGLGKLSNAIRKVDTDHSLLAKKKL